MWFNPGRHLSTTQQLTASSRMEQRIRQIKVRTLMDWDKDSLIGKAKIVHTIHSLQLVGKCLTDSRKVGFIMLGKTNTLSLNVLCCVLFTHTHTNSFSFPLDFTAMQNIIWYGISLQPVSACYTVCVPSQLLVHLQPPHWWGSVIVRNRRVLNAV